MDDARREFATAVRQKRRERGWSQAQLAEAAGVSEGTISGLERFLTFPQPQNVRAIAEALGLDPDGFAPPAPADSVAALEALLASSEPHWFDELHEDVKTALYMVGMYLERYGPEERDARIREIVRAIIDRRL